MEKERLDLKVQSLEEIIKIIKEKVEPQIREWEKKYFEDLIQRYKNFKNEWNKRIEEGDKTPYWNIYPNFLNKTEYNIVYGRNEKSIKELIKKDGDSKLSKIDTSVRKKINEEIKEVISGSIFSSLEMGEIDGEFLLINSNNEEKILSFESVLVGGHNIQRLHFRTLFKYTKNKK